MDGDTRYSIGDLARRTGLSVRTIRFYSDRGLRPPTSMHKLVKLSDAERRRIIHQFIDEAFGDLDANPDMVAMLRSAMPELSDDPTPRAGRRLGRAGRTGPGPGLQGGRPAGGRTPGGRPGRRRPVGVAPRTDQPDPRTGRGGIGRRDRPSVRAGPPGPRRSGRPLRPDVRQGRHPDYRSKLLIRLQIANDPRVERYWHLLATINGWPMPPTLAPVFEWFMQALQHHPDPTTTPA